MTHRNFIAAAGLVLTLGGLAAAGSASAPANGQFVKTAAFDEIAQTRSGQLAVQDAYAASVREFGRHMVADSTKLEDGLMRIAAKDNFTVPNTVDARRQAAMNKLSGLSGNAFDREYILEMVVEDRATVATLQNEALYGRSPDLVNWAKSALPVMQNDLRLAKQLQDEQKAAATSGVLTSK